MAAKRRTWSIPEDLRQHIWNVMEEFAFETEDQALRYILRRDQKYHPSKGRESVIVKRDVAG